MKLLRYIYTHSAILIILFLLVPQVLSAQTDHHYQGMQYYNDQNYESAIEAFETALFLDPMRPEAHLMLVSSYLLTQSLQKAEIMAKEGLELFPAMKAFHWMLAETYMQMQKIELAAVQYNIVHDLLSENRNFQPVDISENQVRLRMGQIEMLSASDAYSTGNLNEAVMHMEKAVGYMDNSVEAYLNLAYLYVETEEFEKNLELIEKARSQFPENTDLLRIKAITYQGLDDSEQLLEQYSVIYGNKPVRVEDGIIYAELLLSSGKSLDAMKVLQELLELYPEERKIYDLLISYFDSTLNIDAKRRLLRKMTHQFPDNEDLFEEIAKTYLVQQDWNRARQLYDSLRVKTNNDQYYQLKIASVYEQQDSLKAAERIYREQLSLSDSDEMLLRQLGRNLDLQNAWKSSVEVYEEIVAQSGLGADYTRLGVALFYNSEIDEAHSALKTALSNGPAQAETFFYLSRIEQMKGEMESSIENAEKAIRLSFSELETKQRSLQGEISRGGLASQIGNQGSREELESINDLAEGSFKWFVTEFPEYRVKPVLDELLKKYNLSAVLFLFAGDYFARTGDIQKSIDLLEQSLLFNSRLFKTHFLLGQLYEKVEQIDNAIQSYKRANGIDPNESEIYTSLIRLYSAKGELDTLCDSWVTRYKSEGHPVLKTHLIEALHKADRFEEASQILRADDSR